MARIKVDIPTQFPFEARIPVRITDLNYGRHVGNDAILSLIHEARMQFLHHYGYTEMDLEGAGMIMADVAIEFKAELFYGDELLVQVAATDLSRVGFDLCYHLRKVAGDHFATVALAKTGMVCYDYSTKKIVAVPANAVARLFPPA